MPPPVMLMSACHIISTTSNNDRLRLISSDPI